MARTGSFLDNNCDSAQHGGGEGVKGSPQLGSRPKAAVLPLLQGQVQAVHLGFKFGMQMALSTGW